MIETLFYIFAAVAVLVDIIYLVMLVTVNLPTQKPLIRKLPKVSVIIASRDGTVVSRALRQLRKVKRPKLEIVVVSADAATLRIAKKFRAKAVRDMGVGKAAAANLGTKRASGKILYFMDEDMLVGKDTIAAVCSGLEGYSASVGYNVPENSRTLTAVMARLYIGFLSKIQQGLHRLIGTTFVGGRNLAIRKSTLKKFGGFRNVLTEDIDLSLRMMERGKKVNFIAAKAYDQVPEHFSDYLKQQQRWNVGSAQALGDWEKKFHFHHISLLLFLLFVGLIAPFSLVFLVLAIVYGSWLLLTVPVLGFLMCLSSARGLGRRDVAMLPLTFFPFIAVHTYTLIYSKLRKPDGWYRTPKQ